MNKYVLYQQSYGNDPFWREGYIDPVTNTYITLEEYAQRTQYEDMTGFKLVYPEQNIKSSWKEREQLTGYQEVVRGAQENVEGVLLGRACNYIGFQSKLAVEEHIFEELSTTYLGPKTHYLAELFVHPALQGQGIGTQLLKSYITQCRIQGMQWILTKTTTLKPNPQQMFLKEWFQQIYSYGEQDTRKRALFYLLLDTPCIYPRKNLL